MGGPSVGNWARQWGQPTNLGGSCQHSHLELLREEGFGAAFKALISGNSIHYVGYSFVDDPNLIHTG